MSLPRKRVYVVQGQYPGPHGWEDLTETTDKAQAKADLTAYRANEGYTYRIIRRTIKKEISQ